MSPYGLAKKYKKRMLKLYIIPPAAGVACVGQYVNDKDNCTKHSKPRVARTKPPGPKMIFTNPYKYTSILSITEITVILKIFCSHPSG